MNYGKLVYSLNGKTGGAKFGEVYTAAKGERGFVAGMRHHAAMSVGLIREKRFSTLVAAQNYAVKLTYAP